MPTTTTPTTPPVRTVVKGSGNFVNEVFTDATTGAIVRVNAYTADQLNTIKANLVTQQAAQLKSLTDMLALLA